MKKFILPLVSILLIGTVLTGCSATSNQSAKINTKKTEVAKTATSYYQGLNKADKKKITFKFSQDQDETGDNSADPVYAISLKITNNTKKIVKFDQSKFIVFVSETTKFPSTKSGIITLKPGKSVSINQLIEKVSEQALVGNDSYFIYMNMDNKLAKTLTVVPKESVQNNTGSDSSQSNQQSQGSEPGSNNNQQSQSSGSSMNDDNQQSQVNTRVVPDPRQAYEKLGMDDNHDYNDMRVVRGNGVWNFVDEYGEEWEVFDDGRLKGPGDPEPVIPSDN